MAEAVQEVPDTGELGRSLGTVLRAYLRSVHEQVDDLPGGPRGFQVLSVAAGGACHNQATIAQLLGLDRTVMTYLVDDLVKRDLVERRPDPADRRARQVLLTEAGRRLLAEVSARIAEVEDQLLAPLDDVERPLFRDMIGRIARARPADDADPCTEPGSAC
ncbi:MarR family transcriptional regulator [Pseudonocardia sp. NPDC046786]|uniref:MarR family winged helix-turn-helix transcriptional regulator n=1 Tax=Pseudonocardia sp. NPDC046786 TaxID=3155471 RepID=UPI0034105418